MLTARAAAVIATEIFRMCPSLFVYLRDRCSLCPLRWIASREVYVGAAALTRISAPDGKRLVALDHLPFRSGVLAITPDQGEPSRDGNQDGTKEKKAARGPSLRALAPHYQRS